MATRRSFLVRSALWVFSGLAAGAAVVFGVQRQRLAASNSLLSAELSQARGELAMLRANLGVAAPAATHIVTHGPFAGHVTEHCALVWARVSAAGTYRLVASPAGGGGAGTAATWRDADFAAESDLCGVWELTGLAPGVTYDLRVEHARLALAAGALTAALPVGAPQVLKLVIGSCATEDAGTRQTWRQMHAQDPDIVIFLGDTPYIDSTDLEVQRRRYREFLGAAELHEALTGAAFYATWDDHDFGQNDCDGTLAGKEQSRRAFAGYHALPSYGDGAEGIYSRFRRGAIEVFLLDTRSFMNTESSPVNAALPTLLGTKQWHWLQDGLLASTAPFKLIACGMVWNGAVRPLKHDHWETYAHERDALFGFLGEHKIDGVLLAAGDIHRARVIRHDSRALAGYDVVELISSSMHDKATLPRNAAPHPGLIRDSDARNIFLLLTVDSTGAAPAASARFLHSSGAEIFAPLQFAPDYGR